MKKEQKASTNPRIHKILIKRFSHVDVDVGVDVNSAKAKGVDLAWYRASPSLVTRHPGQPLFPKRGDRAVTFLQEMTSLIGGVGGGVRQTCRLCTYATGVKKFGGDRLATGENLSRSGGCGPSAAWNRDQKSCRDIIFASILHPPALKRGCCRALGFLSNAPSTALAASREGHLFLRKQQEPPCLASPPENRFFRPRAKSTAR